MVESLTAQIQGALDRFVAGEAQAKAELIRISEERLLLLTRSLLRGFPRARELDDTTGIFSESYLRLHTALDEIKPTTVRQFLGLAALEIRRVLLDLVRKLKGRGGLKRPDAVALDGLDSRVVPSGRSSAGAPWDVVEDLYNAIDRLDEDLKEIVMLLYFQGLTQFEAGQLLGVHEDTIKRRWAKARVILAAHLSAFDPSSN
jgi:RNA polymerase sigma factor (sigma-70 family)